jgi:AraC-like DNA-binding protein
VLILWGVEGSGRVLLGEQFVELPARHLAVLFPGSTQRLEAGPDDEWEYCWWTMDGPQAQAITTGFGFGEGIWRVGPAPLEQIFSLDREIRRPGVAGEIGASARVYNLLAMAAQARRTGSSTRPDPVLAAADNLVEERWAEPGFGVEEIAAALGMHRSTLSRRFRAATGMTLIGHLNTVRLQNAMGMLRGGNATVSEVAAHCGFRDVTYFCRVFRTHVGLTPATFRKQG